MLLAPIRKISTFTTILAAAAGCNETNEPKATPVTRLEIRAAGLAAESIIMDVGARVQLSVVAFDQSGQQLAGVSATVTSRLPGLVSVDQSLLATALAGGQVWLVAEAAGATASVKDSLRVTVSIPQ